MCLWNGILSITQLFWGQELLPYTNYVTLTGRSDCQLKKSLFVCSFNFIFTSEGKKKDEKYLLHGNIRHLIENEINWHVN